MGLLEEEVPVDELFPFPPTAPADAPGAAARLPYKELDGYNVELLDADTDPEMIENSWFFLKICISILTINFEFYPSELFKNVFYLLFNKEC